MRDCGEILRQAIADKKVLKKDIAEFIGMHAQNLGPLLNKKSIDAATLEKLCMILELDPMDFFDYRPNLPGAKTRIGKIEQTLNGVAQVSVGEDSGNLLRQLIAEKDARISNLENTVRILSDILANKKTANELENDSADA